MLLIWFTLEFGGMGTGVIAGSRGGCGSYVWSPGYCISICFECELKSLCLYFVDRIKTVTKAAGLKSGTRCAGQPCRAFPSAP